MLNCELAFPAQSLDFLLLEDIEREIYDQLKY